MGKRKSKRAEAKLAKALGKKKRRFGFGKLLILLVVGGGGAVVLSEPLRNKALDALFGAEEEFQYVPPTTGAGAPENGSSGAGGPESGSTAV